MNKEEAWLLEEKYQGQKSEAFLSDLKRLNSGEPLAYIIGYVPFLNCQVYLDSRPLIPRPETEYWVEKAIVEITKQADTAIEPVKVLDLCAGSGAIGVAVAKALPQVSVIWAELDPSHLPVIQKNITSNLTKTSDSKVYQVIESNLFDNLKEKYNFILSNPPYIDPAVDRTESSVKSFEPHLALYGGVSGMELITKIIALAPDYLKPGGQFWLEHEPEQVENINQLASTKFSVLNCNDQYGIKRYSTLKLLPV